MGEHIYETNDNFEFNKINISKPIAVSSGYFILKFTIGDMPFYINPPKCTIKTSTKGGKRNHCDFIFSQENDQFIRWIENLEKIVQDKIYENRTQWFETELEKEDIENYFTSPLKIYKSGKNYILRTNLPTQTQQKQNFKIYDENENEVQFDSITENMKIACILEIQGVKCSSSSFQIDMLVKQMMVLKPIDLFEKCLLKTKSASSYPLADIPEPTYNEEIKMIMEKTEEIQEPANKINLEEMEEPPPLSTENNGMKQKSEDKSGTNELCEVDFDINDMDENDAITIKHRKEMYYELYTEARRKAKIARDLALSAYLEARRIKNTYMLDDILDDSDESDIDELEQME